VKDYPNLQAVLDGCVSADAGQWPQVRVELRRLLEAHAQDQREVERLRAVVVAAIRLLDEIGAQWGGDYLWTKWGLPAEVQAVRDALTRAEGERGEGVTAPSPPSDG
jgi:hypothetical protein